MPSDWPGRPALLWELDPHPDAPDWYLTAPGLDPSFRAEDAAGEALLAAPPDPQVEVEASVASEDPGVPEEPPEPKKRPPVEEPPSQIPPLRFQ